MYSSDSDSSVVSNEDEEGKLYQLVFEMGTSNNKEEEKEEVQIPSSSENSPEYQEADDERMYADVYDTNGPDTDALDNNQGIPVLKEKPWKKPGADITDYFNYGFDEQSWNAYCKKHAKFRAAKRKMYTKIKEGQTRYEEGESCPYSSSGSLSILSSRESSATLDVIGGRAGSRGSVEGRRYLSDEENISQVFTEMSSKEDIFTSRRLPSPSYISSLFAYIPPPPFLYRPGTPASSSFASLNSEHCKGFDDPSTSRRRSSSGVSSEIPRGMLSNAGVINTAKAWERYIWQEKCDKARDKSREHSRDGGNDRGRERDRDRESCSSTHSREERTRRRDTTERGHKHHSLGRSSGEKKNKRHRERRYGDNKEGSSSSRDRKDGGEEGESQSRKKRKRARKKRKDKESNEMSSADQERKLKSD